MAVGRPRSFDVDAALDQALDVFWRKGFEGTSLADLTEAMGINRPSLYAAFGSKEELFRKAVARYEERNADRIQAALDEPDVRVAVGTLLRQNAELMTNPEGPRGCFMVQGALACSEEADTLKREMAERRSAFEAVLRKRFARAIAEGDLPADANANDLARFVAAVSHGIAIQAAGGATRAQLRQVIEVSLRALAQPRKKTGPRGGPAMRVTKS